MAGVQDLLEQECKALEYQKAKERYERPVERRTQEMARLKLQSSGFGYWWPVIASARAVRLVIR